MADDLDPPQASADDAIRTAIKATVAAIPVVGGSAAEILEAVIASPLQKRRDEWCEVVASAIRRLQSEHGIRVEELRDNPVFVDCVLQASQIAVRNSQSEKRDALRNAVLNAGLPHSPEESIQQVFLGYVDAFTVWHLRLLALFDDPPAWFAAQGRSSPDFHSGSLSAVIRNAFPELGEPREFTDQVWRDLYSRGLVNTENLHTMMTGSGCLSRRTTDSGRRFVQFVSAPARA